MKYTVDENFETEGSHTGEKWAEWSPLWKNAEAGWGAVTEKFWGFTGN